MQLSAAAIHDPLRIREAGADLLSLALIDARNHTLAWLAAFEPHLDKLAAASDVDPPLWLVGHAGWFQEYWVARHVQRQRGEAAHASALRLASIDPLSDAVFDPGAQPRAQRWALTLPDAQDLRQYLADTLETTLDLLGSADDNDAGLFVYRLVLRREDQIGEALAAAAQALQLPTTGAESPWPPRAARAARDALWFGAQRFMLGSTRGGFVPANERWAHEVSVLEFEIDAQALSWARYAEFVADGGYDDASCWSPQGWAWVQAEGRRVPRYVEQMRQGVLAQRHGQMQRVSAAQAATHVSRFEAEAWCRWAGRRLPTEVEWELAACGGNSRGFVFGDVFEWTGGSARGWPGHEACVPGFAPLPAAGALGVQRGASWMTRARWRHPRARRFAAPQRDDMFCGLRSCAL
jgi:ergothioneine biosynthesis protein EgtB